MNRVWIGLTLCIMLCGMMGIASAEEDAFMGDYIGERTLTNGSKAPIVAQVLAWGKGTYHVNLLPEFDTRVDALAVIDGNLQNGKVVFTGPVKATIDGDVFSGTLDGGAFTMKQVVRLSSTMGAKPPEGAIVLFDGTSTDAWEHTDVKRWIIDLNREIGGENRVAYLRTNLWMSRKKRARLDLGSFDGIKVWLNGEQVVAKNETHPLHADAVKIPITLKKGMNTLLIKSVQGSDENWGVCARIRTTKGHDVRGIKAGVDADESRARALRGFIQDWEMSEPYQQAGKTGAQLFAVAFAPEQGKNAKWSVYNKNAEISKDCRWALVDGNAMEVRFSSIMSKRAFRDHQLHIEFRSPLMAEARGQGRGNSGVYIQSRYEIQVLDSYGLEGLDNECGGVYKASRPAVNMCAPPNQWQTYDVTFHEAKLDAGGNVTEKARMTVVHNGVTIHENLEVPSTTPGGVNYDLTKPGGIFLQDHGNPVRVRNVWVKEL